MNNYIENKKRKLENDEIIKSKKMCNAETQTNPVFGFCENSIYISAMINNMKNFRILYNYAFDDKSKYEHLLLRAIIYIYKNHFTASIYRERLLKVLEILVNNIIKDIDKDISFKKSKYNFVLLEYKKLNDINCKKMLIIKDFKNIE